MATLIGGLTLVAARRPDRPLAPPAPLAPLVHVRAATLAATNTASSHGRPVAFTDEQLTVLRTAVTQADAIVRDSVYLAVLRRVDANGGIEWNAVKWRLFPDSARRHPTEFLIGRYLREGAFRMNDISAASLGTRTTASTTPCRPYSPTCHLVTRLNPRHIRVGSVGIEDAVTKTLVHEREHAFGQAHGRDQTRRANLCDAAYIMGDLAESLLRFRAMNAPIRPRQRMCPALRTELRARGVVP